MLVEITIVVLGVVIGFQVTAWRQTRVDADREGLNIRQLHADLVETERDVRSVVATEEAFVSTGNLTLIRDDSLRSAITAHLEVVRRVLYV